MSVVARTSPHFASNDKNYYFRHEKRTQGGGVSKEVRRVFRYCFGLANSLLKRGTIEPGTELFGEALEHLIILEIKAYLAYNNKEEDLTYWRSTSKIEVDVVIGDRVGIEIKGKSFVQEKDAKSLLALSEEVPLQRKIIIANEETARVLNSGVEVLPIGHFLRELWAGKI